MEVVDRRVLEEDDARRDLHVRDVVALMISKIVPLPER